jgi:hypothetical protein
MLYILYLFFPPYGSGQICWFSALLLVAISNFVLPVLMLRMLNKKE